MYKPQPIYTHEKVMKAIPESGITIKQLCRKLGCSVSTIRRVRKQLNGITTDRPLGNEIRLRKIRGEKNG